MASMARSSRGTSRCLSPLPRTSSIRVPGGAALAGRDRASLRCCRIAARRLGDDHDPGVRFPVEARKGGPILEVNQGGGVIIVEIVALLEAPEHVGRPVMSDLRQDVP